MNCSHPALYKRNGAMVCIVCGAEVDREPMTAKNTTPEEKPAEGPKKAVKRTRKKATDD
jgi:uncharacterized Zn finger protein (UPF0148 family)